MRLFALLTLSVISFGYALAQKTTRGVIRDAQEHPVPFVKVEEPQTGNIAFSDDEGVFLLSYYGEDSRIVFSKQGYDSLVRPLNGEKSVVVYLNPRVDNNDYHLGYQAGFLDFKNKNKNKNLENMPYLLGESDINRQLQMLPGIEQGNEGYSNLFVRGGDVDQNLLLYNGTPVYNSNHIFGISSVFHNTSINNTSIYRGIAPSKFGGRGSSVISLETQKNGRSTDGLEGEFELTPLNAGLYMEKIIKDDYYYTIAARRSWIDILIPIEVKQNSLNANIYDIQANFGKKLKNNDRLDYSLLHTRDFYFVGLQSNDTATGQQSTFSLDQRWSNLVSSAKYTQYFKDKFTAVHSVFYSGYRSLFTLRQVQQDSLNPRINPPTAENSLTRGIRDIGIHSDWDYQYNNRHRISFGIQSNTRLFLVGKSEYTTTNFPGVIDVLEIEGSENYVPAVEVYIYGEDNFRMNENVFLNVGLRNTIYNYDGFTRLALEPRIHFTSFLANRDAIKLAYNRHNQFVNQLNLGQAGGPDNLWVPSTKDILPLTVNMLEAAYERKLGSEFAMTVNVYLKTFQNLTRVSDLTDAGDPKLDWRSSVVQGTGQATGAEIMFQKSKGDFTGWVSYAYSQSTRLFEDLNEEEFDFTFNRPHMFKLYANFSPKYSDWKLGFNYLIGNGQLFTLPIGKFRDIDGNTVLEYNALNNYRSPMYQRFDLSLIRNKNIQGPDQQWRFYMYNVFGNRNPIALSADFMDNSFTSLTVNRAYLAFVPGIAYIVKF